MKLQKLVYFTHGYYLAATKIKLKRPIPLVDEYFEAWDYGPVLPSLYREYKEFGGEEITRLALELDPDIGKLTIAQAPQDDPIFESIFNFVWKTNAARQATLLSRITHKTGGAWDRARKDAGGLRGKDIPNDYILEDFEPHVKLKQE